MDVVVRERLGLAMRNVTGGQDLGVVGKGGIDGFGGCVDSRMHPTILIVLKDTLKEHQTLIEHYSLQTGQDVRPGIDCRSRKNFKMMTLFCLWMSHRA
jgi:hypothetical protein